MNRIRKKAIGFMHLMQACRSDQEIYTGTGYRYFFGSVVDRHWCRTGSGSGFEFLCWCLSESGLASIRSNGSYLKFQTCSKIRFFVNQVTTSSIYNVLSSCQSGSGSYPKFHTCWKIRFFCYLSHSFASLQCFIFLISIIFLARKPIRIGLIWIGILWLPIRIRQNDADPTRSASGSTTLLFGLDHFRTRKIIPDPVPYSDPDLTLLYMDS